MSLSNRWQAHLLYLRACRLSCKGDAAAALKELERAISLNPSDARLHLRQALLLAELGRQGEAIKAAREATKLQPRNHATWLFLGRILFDFGKDDEALSAFEESLQRQPDNGLAKGWKGLTLLALDKLDEAAPLLKKNLVHANTDLQARLLVVCETSLWPRRQESRSLEEQVEAAEGGYRPAGLTARLLSRFRLSVALLGVRLRLALRPKQRAAAIARARAEELFLVERFDEAMVGFRKAVDLGADQQDAALHLAECALLLRQYNEADKYLKGLPEEELKDPNLSGLAGVVALHRGRYPEAEEKLAYAAQRLHRDFVPAYYCGLACVAQGKLRPARDWFHVALSRLHPHIERLRLEEYLRLRQAVPEGKPKSGPAS